MVKVLVSTFDDWSLLWEPFAHAWTTFFPNCPWPVRFITNEKDAPLDGAIKTGPDTNWTHMTRNALSQVKDDTVFFLHDDCWLGHTVNLPALLDFAALVENGTVDIVRLYRSYQGNQGGRGTYEPDPRLYHVDPSYPYAINLQASFWNRETFLSLLKNDESCWYFETTGSGRGKEMGVKVLCIDAQTTPNEYNNRAYFCYINAISNGRWRLNLGGDTVLGYKIEESTSVPLELRKVIHYV